jgi:hypothetical protein
MKRLTPICKQKPAAPASNRISAARLALEDLLSKNDDRTWTLKQMRQRLDGGKHMSNYVESLRAVGKLRLIGVDDAGHRQWVWHTSCIRPERENKPTVAGPRSHVNAAMPNGDAAYWARALSWGR